MLPPAKSRRWRAGVAEIVSVDVWLRYFGAFLRAGDAAGDTRTTNREAAEETRKIAAQHDELATQADEGQVEAACSRERDRRAGCAGEIRRTR